MQPALPSPKKRSAAFVALLGQVQRATEPRLLRVLGRSQRDAARYGSEVSAMVNAVHSLSTRGGKRLRPALALVGALAAVDVVAPAERNLLAEVGVSLELLQAYFLIHDDWMDEDDERRGGPTAHVELARTLGGTHLGACSAILAGDLAQSLALAHFASLPIKKSRLSASLCCFAEMQTAAIYGQQLDIVARTPRPELTYELKTASYTVRGPLRLGALLIGGRARTLEALDGFSLPAGVAFQLRDDLIGVFGDPARTGKPQGGDLTSGKNTYLLRRALQTVSKKDESALRRVLGKKNTSRAQMDRALSILVESGARAATERRIAELCEEALLAIASPALTARGRTLLAGALSALSERTA